MIAIVDYGVGNLFSISGSLTHLEYENIVTSDPERIHAAERIILPGVGAFGDAMDKLNATGLVPLLNEEVQQGKPFLGICLGMQLLFEESEEYGLHEGLGYLKGRVVSLSDAFAKKGLSLKVPHMGWNELTLHGNHPIMANTKTGDFVYFVHSFYAVGCDETLAASAQYGVTVPAAVARDNVCGCQFHPEKSGKVGLNILRAFADMPAAESKMK